MSRKAQARGDYRIQGYRLTTFCIGVIAVVLLLYAPWYLSAIITCAVMATLTYRNILFQAIRVCGIGLPAWKIRVSSAILIIFSSFAVACAVLGIEFVQGSLEQALTSSGRDDVLIVMRQGSESEMQSAIPKATAALVQTLLKPLTEGGGIPRMSTETVIVSDIRGNNGHVVSGVQVRGVSLESMAEVRPDVKLVDGRMPRQGIREVIIGLPLASKLGGVQPGQRIDISGQGWIVSGTYVARGEDAAGVFADVSVLNEFNHHPYYQTVRLRLVDGDSLAGFKARMRSEKQLSLYDVRTTRQFYDAQARQVGTLVQRLGTTILIVIALGLCLAALNTTYTVVHTRRYELLVLRVLGFDNWALVIGFVLELVCLCLAGATLAVILCGCLLDGASITTNATGTGRLVATLHFVPRAIPDAFSWALVIGLVGGWFPIRSTIASSLARGLARGA